MASRLTWALELFGDGRHPTTRLAALALREEIEARAGRARVLDVGTGTGILAGVALAAGASEVVGIDRDAALVAAARAEVPRARFLVADARDYLASEAGGAFDLVVANLPDPPLGDLAPLLAAAARPAGTLIVSGALLWQADAVRRALILAGGRIRALRPQAGWAGFVVDC